MKKWLFVCFCMGINSLRADPGDLDTSFNSVGFDFYDHSDNDDRAYALATLADDGIAMAGYTDEDGDDNEEFLVQVYTSTGTLQTTFSSDGVATEDFDGYGAKAYDIIRATSGRLLAVGYAKNSKGTARIALARFTRWGGLDSLFSSDGKQTFETSSTAECKAYAVAMDSSNRYIVGGYSKEYGGDQVLLLVRFNSNGSVDTSFGTDGYITEDLGEDATICDVLIDPDSNIVVYAHNNDDEVYLLRYDSDGNLDTSFSSDGILTLTTGDELYAGKMALYATPLSLVDYSYVVCASALIFEDGDFRSVVGVARVSQTGELDTSFADGGYLDDFTCYYTPDDSYAEDIAVDSMGRVLVTGFLTSDSWHYGATLRLRANGTPDLTFGDDGTAWLDTGGGNSNYRGIAFDSHGNILTVGDDFSSTGSNIDTLVVKTQAR